MQPHVLMEPPGPDGMVPFPGHLVQRACASQGTDDPWGFSTPAMYQEQTPGGPSRYGRAARNGAQEQRFSSQTVATPFFQPGGWTRGNEQDGAGPASSAS